MPWPVVLFIIGIVIPWIIPIGTLSLSVYRIVLVATLIPCLVMWMRGKAGPVRVPDLGLVFFCVWVALSLVVVEGIASSVQAIGIFFIETLGAYLLARCFIRTAEDFRNMVMLVSKLVIILLPFAAYEWVTGSKPILSTFGHVLPTVEVTLMQPRWGFWRVQGPFAHSILFGLFCSSIFALTHLVLGRGKNVASRWLLTAAIGGTAFLSMSSAPIAAMMMQSALMAWNWLLKGFRGRWKFLWALFFLAYLVVELGSNQTPVRFYISHFTFDGQTGWFRLAIWEHGSASVRNHPLFGIGFAEYARPSWMGSGSVDNFWLVNAMRHGIPAGVLIIATCFWLTSAIALRKGLDERLESYRTAYLICLATIFFVGCTAHFWGATYVWFLFLLGSGAWMLDAKAEENIPVASAGPEGGNPVREARGGGRHVAAPVPRLRRQPNR